MPVAVDAPPDPAEPQRAAAPQRTTPRRAEAVPAPAVDVGPDRGAIALRFAEAVAERSTIPLSLLLVVGFFLLVQDRLDRNDPKLALAPVYPDPELRFGPRPPRTSPRAAPPRPTLGACDAS